MRKKLWVIALLWWVGCLWAVPALDAIEGNHALSEDEIASHLSRKGLSLDDPSKLTAQEKERAVLLVRQLYQDRGCPLVRVERQASSQGLLLTIAEGPKAKMGWVEFRGNQAISNQQLAQLLKLKGKLDYDRLHQGLAGIRQLYRDSGYPLVEVEQSALHVLERQERRHFPLPFRNVDRNRIRLVVGIKEGTHFRFGTVELPPGLGLEELTPPREGEVYSEKQLFEFRLRVIRTFAARGRLVRRLEILQHPSEPDGRMDIRVRFELYPPLTVGRITFEGNQAYPDKFYRRELAFSEDQVFDLRKLARSLEAVNSTGVLKEPLTESDVELLIDEADGRVDVLFQLTERKRQNIWHTLSRSDLGGVQARVVYAISNLLGLGEVLGFEVSHGGGTTGAAVSLASRYLLGTDVPISLGLRFFRRKTGLRLGSVDDEVEEIFNSRQAGFSGSAAYRIRTARGPRQVGMRFTAASFELPQETYQVALEPFWIATTQRSDFWSEQVDLSTRFSFFSRSLDSWNWRPALDYRATAEQVPGPGKFTFRLQASHARFSPGEQLLTERLFGDSDTIRGFSGTTLGPWGLDSGRAVPIGGDSLLAVNSEYEIALTKAFRAAPFFDTGVNFTSANPFDFQLLHATNRIWRASLGGELRVDLPGLLPEARLVAAWNPLRLDRSITTAKGLARLRDPKAALRLAFDPVF